MKLFFPPILFLTFIFAGVKKGEETTVSSFANFHESRIIVKVELETSLLNLRYEGLIQLTGVQSIDILNRKYFCVRISKLFDQVPINQKKYDALEMGNYYVFSFSGKKNIPELVDLYIKTNLFIMVEADYKGYAGSTRFYPDDNYYFMQWSLENDGTFPSWNLGTADADIDMEAAWDITQGSSSVTVGILDTGLKLDHPEFEDRIWINGSELDDGIDNDDNGFTDDFNGWDFVNEDNDPYDDQGHGSSVGGILGATGNNSIGYAGIDWNCRLMSLKILNEDNFGYYSWWTDAIYYATNNGANILNMSVGGSSFSNSMGVAVDYAHASGVTIFACMMNENNNVIYYPAGYSNTIAVGATDTDDSRCNPFTWGGGSNYGNHIDISAPGNHIYGLNHVSNFNFSWYWGGTSQATPHVAGLGSLLAGLVPGISPDSIKSIITLSAQDTVGEPSEDVIGWDQYHGWGRINAHDALSLVSDMDNDGLVDYHDNCPDVSNVDQQDIDMDNIGDSCDHCNNAHLSSFYGGNLDADVNTVEEASFSIFDILLLSGYLEETEIENCQYLASDLNNDGSINDVDIALLISYVMNW